jgi:hypothetical protein
MGKIHVIHMDDNDLHVKFKMAENYAYSYFKYHVTKETDCFVNGELMFSYRRKVFKDPKYFNLLETNLVPKLLNSDHRKIAGGAPGQRVNINSGIVGFYDKLTPQMKSALGGVNQAGRETAFVKHHKDRWKRLVPFFQQISQVYKRTCPKHFMKQETAARKVHKDLTIDKTVFTTITMNKNWRTSTHTDKGDFEEGMSCLIILGNNYTGGYLGFPRLGILVHVEHGDVLFMNSHEPHCNSQLNLNVNGKGKGTRYSIVCYLRTDLQRFHKKKTIGKDVYFLE